MTDADPPQIMAVDDDAILLEVLDEVLSGPFHVITAHSGEECLRTLPDANAVLVLLDVEMPGIGGYETCRRIKATPELADLPVLFLSSHDAIEDRLKGYEVGGEDYIVKPFEPTELERKIHNLIRLRRERDQQKEMASYASSTAMTAMTSLGEMGVLIEAMKRFNTCVTQVELADACLGGLAMYGLKGAAQIRTSAEKLTRVEGGVAAPLVVSIIKHMTAMDRITSFKSRMCVTYENISLLVNNMPEDDPERYGRLRDHLAMLAEGANVRAQAIMLADTVNSVAENLAQTLDEIDAAQRQNRIAVSLALSALNERIARAYMSLGLTSEQEDFLSHTIQLGIDDILNTQSSSTSIQDKLSVLIHHLKHAE